MRRFLRRFLRLAVVHLFGAAVGRGMTRFLWLVVVPLFCTALGKSLTNEMLSEVPGQHDWLLLWFCQVISIGPALFMFLYGVERCLGRSPKGD